MTLLHRRTRRRLSDRGFASLESLEQRLVLSASSVLAGATPISVAATDQVFAAVPVADVQRADRVPAEVRALLSTGQRQALRNAATAVRDVRADLRVKKATLAAAQAAVTQTAASLAQAQTGFRIAKARHAAATASVKSAAGLVQRMQAEVESAQKRKARFESDAANLVKSGLIEDWTRRYGADSHEVRQARSALQQQLDGAAAAKKEIAAAKSRLATARTGRQTAIATAQTTRRALDAQKSVLTAARTAHTDAKTKAQSAAKALRECRTALAAAQTSEQRAVRTALNQASARARALVEQHAAILRSFRSASETFRQKLAQVDQRRASVSGLANWFAVMSEVAGEFDSNPDPTQALELGSRLLDGASKFLFPSLSQLSQNAKGEREAGKAGDIQLWEAIDAGNRLHKYAAQLDGAQKNLEKVHAAQPFLEDAATSAAQ